MSMSEDEARDQAHAAISDKILNAIQEAISEGHFGGAGMVASFITVVEVVDDDGKPGLSVLYSDKRLTVLLGLLDYGQMWAHSHSMGGS